MRPKFNGDDTPEYGPANYWPRKAARPVAVPSASAPRTWREIPVRPSYRRHGIRLAAVVGWGLVLPCAVALAHAGLVSDGLAGFAIGAMLGAGLVALTPGKKSPLDV